MKGGARKLCLPFAAWWVIQVVVVSTSYLLKRVDEVPADACFA